MTNLKILIKLPSRERPQKVFDTLDNIFSMAATNSISVLCSFDISDSSMTNVVVRDKVMSYKNVIAIYGTSASKVQAINADVWTQDNWDILIAHADDMEILTKGFDSIIIEDMRKHFSDTDGCLHYPDGSPARDNLMTWPVIGRKFYDRFNYIYNESYSSVYCDNEQTEIAKRLGKHKFINNQLVSHNHPIWRKTEWDALYRRNEDQIYYKKDKETYFKRLNENFGL